MELKSNIQVTTDTPVTQQLQYTEQVITSINQTPVTNNQLQKQQQASQELSNQYDPNAFLEDYLKTEQKLYLSYLEVDFSREFKYNEYIEWRTQKSNEFKNKISNYHKLITQKYIYQTFMFNKQGDISISLAGYNQFIPSCIQEYPYLTFYLIDAEKNSWDVSDYHYRWYENEYQNRLIVIEQIRSIIREGKEYTYSQNVFNEYISAQTEISAEGYKAYYKDWQIQEQQNKLQEQKNLKELIASIQNINLFVFEEYKTQCENFGLLPTKEGYLDYENKAKTTFSENYLKELNQDLIEQRQQIQNDDNKNKQHKVIVNDLNEYEQQYLQIDQQKENGDQEEVEIQNKIIQSSSCQCCKGKPYDCQGQACQLLGNCVCIST